MASVQKFVSTWMASGRDEEIRELVSEITHGQATLIDLVKALEEYLTSEEAELRTKGVDLLASVIEQVPLENLNRQQVRVLTTFLGGKLEDLETKIPALKGLNAISKSPRFSSSDTVIVVNSIFSNITMKAFVASVRFFIFSIFDTLMAHNRDALKEMGSDFVAKYIVLVEGEKDPRNLLIAFALARVLAIEFDVAHRVESLFNIIFCYFPITFRPPPNDPYGITTDDLRMALRAAMCASPAFGPMAVPVFLEKLLAGSPASKKDTLETMTACLPIYGPVLARANARKLWNSLKLEIFQPTDAFTEQEALKATQALLQTIHVQEGASEADIQGFARDACEECIQILREPEKSQARPAIKILCTFMSITPSVSRYTLSQAVPHLLNLFSNPSEVISRPPILVLLSDLMNASRDSTIRGVDSGEPSFLVPYKDELLGAADAGLKVKPSRLPALALIKGLVTTKSLLTNEELRYIVHILDDVFTEEGIDYDDLSDSATLNILTSISSITPRHVEEQTLSLLFSILPDAAPSRHAVLERAKYWRSLLALNTICVQAELFETLVVRLLAKLDLICVPGSAHQEASDLEPRAAYAYALLKTIKDTLVQKVDNSHPDVTKYIDRLVPRLYNLFIFSALEGRPDLVARDQRLIREAGEIISLVVQSLSQPKQEKLVSAIFDVFTTGSIQGISEGFHKLPSGTGLSIFAGSATTEQKNIISLLVSGVIPSRKEVPPPLPNLEEFLEGLLAWSLDLADTILQRESAWHLVASIVNKHVDKLQTFLENKLSNFWVQNILNKEANVDRRRHAIEAWAWVSKALIIRNHPLAYKFTDLLLVAFSDEEISWTAATAVGRLAGADSVLTKQHHVVLRILHSQKFLNHILPEIAAGAKNLTKPQQEQTAYLVALTGVIKTSPKATYVNDMPNLIPLLLRGLDLPNADIRADVIDTFLSSAEDDSPETSLVAEHATNLVSLMLKNSRNSEMPSTRVRVGALKYLGVLTAIVRYDVLHPQKASVLRELGKVLDDPKKVVRKEAVDTREIWFKYSG